MFFNPDCPLFGCLFPSPSSLSLIVINKVTKTPRAHPLKLNHLITTKIKKKKKSKKPSKQQQMSDSNKLCLVLVATLAQPRHVQGCSWARQGRGDRSRVTQPHLAIPWRRDVMRELLPLNAQGTDDAGESQSPSNGLNFLHFSYGSTHQEDGASWDAKGLKTWGDVQGLI